MNYILYNPLANCGDGMKGLDGVIAAVKERAGGREPALLDVTKTDPAPVLLGLTAQDEAVVCGGDGTLHYLINALDGQVPAGPVYVWRMGTGNDFLRDVLGKTGDMVLLNPYLENLPTAEVKGERIRFLNNASFGLDGQVCELGEQEKERLGRRVNYIGLALRLVLKDYRMAKASVTVDGETRTYERVWVASAFNGRFVGGGMMLAPDQDRKSDKLCVVVLHGAGRAWVLLNLVKVYWGGHVKLPQCDIRYGRDVTVTFDEPAAFNMDGEVISNVPGFHAVK